MRRRCTSSVAIALACGALTALVGLPACNTGPKDDASLAPAQAAKTAQPAAAAPAAKEGALRLGSAIEASAVHVALADVAKNPSAFVGKKFATTGTVTAVCQHMGCWMEIKDEATEAHVKMAGHSFFVPKTASGRRARVLATLVKSEDEAACAEEGMHAASGGAPAGSAARKGGCRAEAEAQLGRPLAKLALVAEGVELM